MKHFFSEIITNNIIAKDFHSISFRWEEKASAPSPGQFLTIRVSDSSAPLLRRPFAVSGYNESDGTASIIYQRRGVATEILSGKECGDSLDIIGPLGTSFNFQDAQDTYILVAGGIGLGPMIYTAEHVRSLGKKVIFIYGAKSSSSVPEKEIQNMPELTICTDDGSKGIKGTTVDGLNSLVSYDLKRAAVMACGPLPMLKGCHDFAQKNSLPCEVLMEQVMACGVGACMGCAIKVKRDPGYERVCLEGAVFNSKDIVWT